MNEVKAALKFSNMVIYQLGGSPQENLLAGIRNSATECPIARTIKKGLENCRASAFVGLSKAHITRPSYGTTDFKMWGSAERFIVGFDNGHYPEYDRYALNG